MSVNTKAVHPGTLKLIEDFVIEKERLKFLNRFVQFAKLVGKHFTTARTYEDISAFILEKSLTSANYAISKADILGTSESIRKLDTKKP
ncbi:Oidioi.mRNA.OKI2018_I69.chr1.g131.t1.cds [Oikopleura dioica]|uniref:Oidioi.mRNA.OKI2018_I69.chr1.g131.t1.cds n=1 Tax=Oikopleura dioica TaxID=34765 RepID=A0ABN7SIW5_OIKDI|nr:Oidioi.mRNA.OKI2018_I69.chr1.g131.t1.cds [Oikopleura dioica]